MSLEFYPTNNFVFRRPYINYKGKSLDKKNLDNLIRQDFFQEAIYYASPDLYSELMKYLGESFSKKKKQRMIATVYKYAQRMLYRCTPFGMFAFCGTGKYSDKTYIPNNVEVRLHYRYDSQFLYDYISFIIKNASSELLSSLSICTNQTLLRVADNFKMSTRNENGMMIDIRVQATDLLEHILNFSRNGVGFKDVIDSCLKLYDIDIARLSEYVKNLIAKGLLMTDLQIETIGGDNFYRIYQKWRHLNLPLMSDMNDVLSIIQSDRKFNEKKSAIDSLYDKAHELGINVKRNQIIQVDAFSKSPIVIDKRISDSLIEWFSLMSAINARSGNSNNLANFVGRFSERYENRSVPLLKVLDKQIGIGLHPEFPSNSTFIDKIYRVPGNTQNKPGTRMYNLNIIEQVILDTLLASRCLTTKVLNLTNEVLKKYGKNNQSDYPMSYSCMFSIVGYNENGPILSGVRFTGPSAACLLTRFADGHDGIREIVNKIGLREQSINPDTILAEISHLARPHSGNVQIRPSFRKYLIPYLSFGKNDGLESVDLQDLLVSVSSGKVKLHCTSTGKEVIPCYTSAFNYKFGTSELYQFLGDIQQQNSANIFTVQTDSLLLLLKHIPRIAYKNIIIYPEAWMVENSWDGRELSIARETFRNMHKNAFMPRFLSFNQGDNYFIIDIESDISLNEFFNLSKKIKNVSLKEFLPLVEDFSHYATVMEIIQPFIPSEK